MRSLIYGKQKTERIVSIEVEGSEAVIFIQQDDGTIAEQRMPYKYWLLLSQKHSDKLRELKGNQHYRYYMEYDDQSKYFEVVKSCKSKRYDYFTKSGREALMLKDGYTYFKGMRVQDVSVLSFDIETTGLEHNQDSRVLLISNTFRDHKGVVTKKLFQYDLYVDQGEMIWDWCTWVNNMNPSVVVGHNILKFDLPYLQHVASMNDEDLWLGRDESPVKFDNRTSEFRKDGSQSYTYTDCRIFGREVVDTFFLSLKYDVGRKYESYGLKSIIKQEGLEKKDRQHYDGSKIAANYKIADEWQKIKEYAKDDADDALALYDLMIPSIFYYTQSIPMGLQRVVNGATGSQVNALMIRAYLQQGYSLPKASDQAEYEGAISFGHPGIYKHVYKVDVASLYPSIIRQYEIHDKAKDPERMFLKMVDYFTLERLNNKSLAKETGDRYYKDLEQAQKIMINSAYGFLGAPGLMFNSPKNAALVTKMGREILNKGIAWSDSKGYKIVNADTDSFSYTSSQKMTKEHFSQDIVELNGLFPDIIRWEDDGYYKTVLIVKAKNYVLEDEKGKIKVKGSALKGTQKEKALQKFMNEAIELLLKGRKDRLFSLYSSYVSQVVNLKDISEWCSKKTITKSILNPERTTEQRIFDAIDGDSGSEGAKVYMFFKTDTELCLRENFDGTFDQDRLFEKLYNTLCVFETVVDVDLFPNYSLKRNKELLCS